MAKYVYAQSHKGSAWDWWERIDSEDATKRAANRRVRAVVKRINDPHAPALFSTKEGEGDLAMANLRLLGMVLRDRECNSPHLPGWYANRCGGMCPRMHAIGGEIEAESFPDCADDARGFNVSCWPNGTHWYARLRDGTDVEIGGISKWDSKEEAEAAAAEFITAQAAGEA